MPLPSLEISENGWEWLKMTGDGCKWLDITKDDWKWLGMAGNGYKCLKGQEMVANVWKCQVMVGNNTG